MGDDALAQNGGIHALTVTNLAGQGNRQLAKVRQQVAAGILPAETGADAGKMTVSMLHETTN